MCVEVVYTADSDVTRICQALSRCQVKHCELLFVAVTLRFVFD